VFGSTTMSLTSFAEHRSVVESADDDEEVWREGSLVKLFIMLVLTRMVQVAYIHKFCRLEIFFCLNYDDADLTTGLVDGYGNSGGCGRCHDRIDQSSVALTCFF